MQMFNTGGTEHIQEQTWPQNASEVKGPSPGAPPTVQPWALFILCCSLTVF